MLICEDCHTFPQNTLSLSEGESNKAESHCTVKSIAVGKYIAQIKTNICSTNGSAGIGNK